MFIESECFSHSTVALFLMSHPLSLILALTQSQIRVSQESCPTVPPLCLLQRHSSQSKKLKALLTNTQTHASKGSCAQLR